VTEELDEAALVTSEQPPASRLGRQLGRLGKQSAIYGLGSLVSRILALILLPLYTHYIPPAGYGRVETLIAWQAVAVILLRAGISTAFFRFYFDEQDEAAKTLVVRTSFWFTMTMATAGLALGLVFAHPFSVAFGNVGDSLVRAAFVGIWAQMNYEQLTSLFRVEQRALAFGIASLANVFVTILVTFVLIVHFHKGPLGLIVGNFTGTLAIYLVLVAYRRYQLGLQFDRRLLRAMNRFGMPLVPSALALWAINFMDRFLLIHIVGKARTGDYSLAVRVSSGIAFLLYAFRTAWPAYAYSITDDREAKQTYGFVLTYLVLITSWCALALGVLSPWLVRILARGHDWTAHDRRLAEGAIAPLAFSLVAYGAYTVVAIGVGRARKTGFNWIVTGAAAVLNIALVVALVPAIGIFGAALASLAAYVAMFLGMVWNAQRVYPVRYQWRRIALVAGTAGALTVAGRLARGPLALELGLALALPFVLFPLGFYLPGERARLGALLRL
jgi:O-antigen/teichoic acid export membrane protein